jgi:hypothetical protein
MSYEGVVFVIPTYRLRDVCDTVVAYDTNFWNSGHATSIVVFDDSTVPTHEKYYPALERTRTHSDLFYVGPAEKEQFLALLNKRLRDRKLESIVRNLFRPSYGGNRNFTLMYSLGSLMVSSDDDMRPEGLIEDSPESLGEDEISRGKLLRAAAGGYTSKPFDIVGSFIDVVGKRVADVPKNFEKGELVVDTSMELETNTTKGLTRENSLMLQQGKVSKNAIVKMGQTFRSGTNDIDAIDFVELYLEEEEQTSFDDLNDVYVLVNFRPVLTNLNWRMDCGVAAYDNSVGLPPFFPTRLRFEDYIYRLWIQQDGIVSAHVDAAQTHIKNNYMRNPLAAEVFNEEVANLLKRRIKATCHKIHELTIEFDYEGGVTADESNGILDKIGNIHARALKSAAATGNEARWQALQTFASNLEKAFYGFDPDFFQQNVSRITDDVISQIKGSLELWPTLVEICYFQRHRAPLPQRRVHNQSTSKKTSGSARRARVPA